MDNISVFGAEFIVHLNADGAFKKTADKSVRDITVYAAPNDQDYEATGLAMVRNETSGDAVLDEAHTNASLVYDQYRGTATASVSR